MTQRGMGLMLWQCTPPLVIRFGELYDGNANTLWMVDVYAGNIFGGEGSRAGVCSLCAEHVVAEMR